MTPKEKAEELFMLYINNGLTKIKPIINRLTRKEMAKKCAIIAVNTVLSTLSPYLGDDNAREFWKEVKQEIEAL